MASDNDTVYVPDYLSSNSEDIIYIPTYLSISNDESVTTFASGCCTTECSEYCMSSQSGGGCSQYCGESCGETCTQSCYQSCSESGCCTTECSEYCMSTQGCSESCGQSTSTKPGNATSLTITGTTYSTISISFASVSNANYYEIAYRVSGSSSTTYETVSGTSYTITGLEPGTTYVVNYRGVNDAGVGSFLSTGKTATTESVSAYIEVMGVGSTSVTVRLNGLATSYAYNDRKCQWFLNGVVKIQIPFGAGLSYAAQYTFTGLVPNTTYEIMAIITGDAGGGFTKTLYEYVTTINIPKWTWTDANYSGSGHATATQTINAYNALTNNGYTEEFSYLVWNDMCQKVNDVLYNAGYSWDTTFASYVNTKMTGSGQCLTAAQFNSLKQNIGSHYSTGIPDVSSGDLMYGSYFITLMSKVNSWIDTL